MKRFNLGTIKMDMENNGFPKGLILKRFLFIREARHVMSNLLGININTRDEYDTNEEYKEYNEELRCAVNLWLTGDYDDYTLMEYAGDCADEQLGLMNMIPILCYLKKKNIID